MSLKKAIAGIKNNQNFLITTHINLEGDALASELAFFRILKAMGKQAIIINADNTPLEYAFLPGINNIKKFSNNLKNIKFDCFVVLDCSGLSRCGRVASLNIDRKPVLNIDHHISNKWFADINWVEPSSSSCTQMIYKLCKELRVPLDKEIAMLLYVGILTDTGSFRYPNTNSLTHKVVSELLKHNLDIVEIYKKVYENIAFKDMRLLVKVLSALKCQLNGKIAYLTITRQLLKKYRGISFDLTDYTLNFARAIKDVEVAVLFKEDTGQENKVRVNLRSQGKIDVNKIAQFFGGGGHKTASGCTIKGNIEEVRRKVLREIKESFK